jgi:SAM-dependent methyltransferase
VSLHDDETRKLAFGAYAEEYDAARPRYPAALIDAVAAHARIGPSTTALEVGSGTGIATLPFAETGCAIRCLELSEGMAAVARKKLARFPRVTIETTRFEDWAAPESAFDLVFCAQAWHWLAPQVRYAKARRALRPGGTLAIFSNRDAAVLEEVQPAYRRLGIREIVAHEPEAWRDTHPPDLAAGIDNARASIEKSGCFRDVTFRTFPWQRTFTTAEYIGLLRTYSDHVTLPAEVREPLLDDIAAAIDAAGGSVTRFYATILMLARPAK